MSPDISKCNNEQCPRKESCYRYTCEADEYQSYADFESGENCEGYWSNNY